MWVTRLTLILVLLSTTINNGLAQEEQVIIQEGIYEEETYKEIAEIPEIIKFEIQGLTLSEGIVSEEVLRIKGFLKEKGYIDNIEHGYYFDFKTKEGIIKYQEDNGLIPDGKIGKNTYDKINKDMETENINIPAIEIIFNSQIPKGYYILINKDNNTLYHLKGEEIVNKYHIGTGKLPELTPEGKFTIVNKVKNPAWGGAGRHRPVRGGAPNNPIGKRWMGLNIKGGSMYGIHGNSDKNSIGRYISLGCIRMFNEDVENLYELIEIGIPVWVGSEEKLKDFGILFKWEINNCNSQ